MKRLIYSISLTCYKTICPYCRCDNPETKGKVDTCKYCGKVYDCDMEVRKSKDYEEVERAGLHGAVHKNDKGKWEQWVNPFNKFDE